MVRLIAFVFAAVVAVSAHGQRVNLDQISVRDKITLRGKPIDSISIDKTFASPSNTEISTQKAVFDFVAAQIAAINLSNYARSASADGLFVTGNIPFSDGTGKLGENNNVNFLSGVMNAPAMAINGTGGAGYFRFIPQSSAPGTPGSGFRLFADASGRLAWKGTNGFVRTFDGVANTADRLYTLPDANGTFNMIDVAQTITAIKTFSPSGSGGAGFIYSSTTRPAHPIGNVTTAQRDAMTGQGVGDVVFNTTTGRYNFWNGSAWVSLPKLS